MNTCLPVNFFHGEIPSDVQEVIENLLRDSDTEKVFKECKFLPPVSACTSCENHIYINLWNGSGIQFRICFNGEERHFFFVAHDSIASRTEQNRTYAALESAANFAFAEERRKNVNVKTESVLTQSHATIKKPEGNIMSEENTQEPVAQPLVGKAVVPPAVAKQNPAAEQKPSPKDSLPDICKKILTAIENDGVSSDNVPREYLSGIIKEFFSPCPPRTLKLLVAPVYRHLHERSIITVSHYDPRKKPWTNGYRRPAMYSLDIVAMKMCAEGNTAFSPNVVREKKTRKTAPPVEYPVLSLDCDSFLASLQQNLVWVDQQIRSLDAIITETETTLLTAQNKRAAFIDVKECIVTAIEGFKKLDV